MFTPVEWRGLSLPFLTKNLKDRESFLDKNTVLIVRQLTQDWWSRWVPVTCKTSELTQKVFRRVEPDMKLVDDLFDKLTEGFEGESRIEWIVRKLRGY